MGLPRQQGPFAVGAIDLEIPVRKPRSFASDIVEPSQINRPSGKKGAASARERGQQGDGEGSKAVQNGDGDDHSDNNGLSDWSPLAHGSKTSTLHLSTVLFTIFYPCAGTDEELAKNHRRVAWLGRPKTKGAKALASYISQYGFAGPFAAVPASPALATLIAAKMHVWGGPPLADPNDPKARAPPPQNRPTVGLFGHEPASFPVVVFSHGLAGSRLAYSQYCSELASQGIIVAAIEHRDGSGIASMVRPPVDPRLSNKEQSAEKVDGTTRSKLWKARHHHPKSAVPYFTFEAVGLRSFPTDPNEKEVGMRQAQLAMRCAEIEECLHVLKRIANGEGADVVSESTRTLTTKLCGRSTTRKGLPHSLLSEPLSLKSWQGKIDTDYPALAGHSFGGATTFELLRGENPPFPFGISLDPWVEPIVIDDDDPRPLRAPVYVMNSESFTLWGSHFEKVKRIVSDAQQANREHRGWLMTLAASEHLSFSDYPLLLPRIFRTSVSPRAAIEIYTRATLVQIGLLRQRYRERAGQPGVKFGGRERLDKEQSKDETMGVRQEGKGVTRGRRTASPEPVEAAKPPPAGQEVDGDDDVDDEAQQHSKWEQFAQHERATAENEMVKAVESGQDPIRANVGSDEPVINDSGDQQGNDEKPFPSASQDKYRSQLESTQDPVFQHGEEREDTMLQLKKSKDEARDTLLARKEARRQGEALDKDDNHESRSPYGIVAYRTDSGGMASRPRRSDELSDLVTDPAKIEDEALRRDLDHDVEVVHASLKDLSESQRHKKRRTRSLAALLYRSMGIRPSLGETGAVLVHDLRRSPHEGEEAGEEGEEAGGAAPSVAQGVEERRLE